MGLPEEKHPRSLHAFIEQTARMLRNATKRSLSKPGKFKKDPDLTNKNRISQIASLLRSEAKKKKKKK